MIEDFSKLNKTPSDGTCLEKPPGGFSDVGCCCCCFTLLEVFTFPSYFSLPPALHPGFSGPWRPPPALSSTLATFGYFAFARLFRYICTASATVLSGRFLHTQVFFLTCPPSPHFGTFLWLRCGQENPIQDPPLCMPSQSCPSGWRMVLKYSFCRFKTIGLSIAPVSHEV